MSPELSIKVEGLYRRYGSFVAVDDVTFDVKVGEIFGYLGANGAGKSTTIRILCGLLAASQGKAMVAGVDVIRDAEGVRRSIGYMSQKFSLYLDLTVYENLAFFGGAYGLFGKAFRNRRDAALAELGLESLGDALTSSLAMGLRQRLALACSLLHEPKVVFLDEPTAGVDPEARRNFWRIIRQLASRGTTIFVTTHYMDEAEYCDRVGLMVSGKLAALDTPDGLKRAHVPGRMLEVHGANEAEVRVASGSRTILGVEPFGAALHVLVPHDGIRAGELGSSLAAGGLERASVADTAVTLEDVFLRVVRGAENPDTVEA